MDEIKRIVEQELGTGRSLQSFQRVYRVNQTSRVRFWFWGIMAGLAVILFLPWTQNIRARGSVTTLRQEFRPQELNAIIAGRIVKWHVREGDFVKAGDTILQLAEIKDDYLDPQLIERTATQMEAKKMTLQNYRDKASAIDRQLDALQQTRILKQQDFNNKIGQQRLKIRSDSMEYLAAVNDFNIKSEQFRRQKELYDAGLVSLVQLEQRNQALQESMAKRTTAEISFNNARQEWIRLQIEWNSTLQEYLEKISKAEGEKFQVLSQIAGGEGEVAKIQNQYQNYVIRSGQYVIKAPQDGQIINARKQGLQEVVGVGELLAYIVPLQSQLAVEIFVRPVDLPLVDTGQDARLIFDGFPAIVFSGWPQASYGIFSGKVFAVETAVSEKNGLFRVLIVEEKGAKPWPPQLRNGTGVSSISLLKNVPVWYELWRNINGFPPEYYKQVGPDQQKAKPK